MSGLEQSNPQSSWGFVQFRKEKEAHRVAAQKKTEALENMYGKLIQHMRKFPVKLMKNKTIAEAGGYQTTTSEWMQSILPKPTDPEMHTYGFLRRDRILAVDDDAHDGGGDRKGGGHMTHPAANRTSGSRGMQNKNRRDFGSGWQLERADSARDVNRLNIPVRRFIMQHIDDSPRFLQTEDFPVDAMIQDYNNKKDVFRFLRQVVRVGDTVHAVVGDVNEQPIAMNEMELGEYMSDGVINRMDLARSLVFNSCGSGSHAKFVRGAGAAFRMVPGPNKPPFCRHMFMYIGPVTPVNSACNVDVPSAIGVNIIVASRDPSKLTQDLDKMQYSLVLQLLITPLKRAFVSVAWGKSSRTPKEYDYMAVNIPWVLRDWTLPEGLTQDMAMEYLGRFDSEVNVSANNRDIIADRYRAFSTNPNDPPPKNPPDDRMVDRDDKASTFPKWYGWPVKGSITSSHLNALQCCHHLKVYRYKGSGRAFCGTIRSFPKILDYRDPQLHYDNADRRQAAERNDEVLQFSMNLVYEGMPLAELVNRIDTYEPDMTLVTYPLQSIPVSYENNTVLSMQYSMEFVGPFMRSQIMLMYHTHLLKLVVVGLTLDCMRLVGMFGDPATYSPIPMKDMMKFMYAAMGEVSDKDGGGGMMQQQEFERAAEVESYRTAFPMYVKKIMYMWHHMVGTFPFGCSQQRDCTARELHKIRFGLELLIDSLAIQRWNLLCKTKEWLDSPTPDKSSHCNNGMPPSKWNSFGNARHQNIFDYGHYIRPEHDTGRKLSQRLELQLIDTINSNAMTRASIDKVIQGIQPVVHPMQQFEMESMLRLDSTGPLECAMLRFPIDIDPINIFVDLGTPAAELIHDWRVIQYTFMPPRETFGVPASIMEDYQSLPRRPSDHRDQDRLISTDIRKFEKSLLEGPLQWKQAVQQARYGQHAEEKEEELFNSYMNSFLRKHVGGSGLDVGFDPATHGCAAFEIRELGKVAKQADFIGVPDLLGSDGLVKLGLEMKHKVLEVCVVVPGIPYVMNVQKISDVEYNGQCQQGSTDVVRKLDGLMRMVRNMDTPAIVAPGFGGPPSTFAGHKSEAYTHLRTVGMFNYVFLKRKVELDERHVAYDRKLLTKIWHAICSDRRKLVGDVYTYSSTEKSASIDNEVKGLFNQIKNAHSSLMRNRFWVSRFHRIHDPSNGKDILDHVRYSGDSIHEPTWTPIRMEMSEFGLPFWRHEIEYGLGTPFREEPGQDHFHYGFRGFCKSEIDPEPPRGFSFIKPEDIQYIMDNSDWRFMYAEHGGGARMVTAQSYTQQHQDGRFFWLNCNNATYRPDMRTSNHGRAGQGPPGIPSIRCHFGGFTCMRFPPESSLGIFCTPSEHWSCYYSISPPKSEGGSVTLIDDGSNANLDLGSAAYAPQFRFMQTLVVNPEKYTIPVAYLRDQQGPANGTAMNRSFRTMNGYVRIDTASRPYIDDVPTSIMQAERLFLDTDGCIHMSFMMDDGRVSEERFGEYVSRYVILMIVGSGAKEEYMKKMIEYDSNPVDKMRESTPSVEGDEEGSDDEVKDPKFFLAAVNALMIRRLIEAVACSTEFPDGTRAVMTRVMLSTYKNIQRISGIDFPEHNICNISPSGFISNFQLNDDVHQVKDIRFDSTSDCSDTQYLFHDLLRFESAKEGIVRWDLQLLKNNGVFTLISGDLSQYYWNQLALLRSYAKLPGLDVYNNDDQDYVIRVVMFQVYVYCYMRNAINRRVVNSEPRANQLLCLLQDIQKSMPQIDTFKKLSEFPLDESFVPEVIRDHLPLK